MRLDIITIFPEMVEPWAKASLIGSAVQRGLVEIHLHDLKRFSGRKDGRVDDRPFGGGPGMVFRPDPVMDALESIPGWQEALRLHPSPAGQPWVQASALKASGTQHIIMLCSRYEGVDERALQLGGFVEAGVGDFVCMGGEAPAMMMAESVVRLLPGVLGDEQSALQDSFSGSGPATLDCPHYTRPAEYRGLKVPDVLVGGDHAKVDAWRKAEGLRLTRERRPDLGRC
ncbi:MAG: tRNA (guanosine(37)-N1)-methyltransferase TrmD [Planctomycetota bacterium]